MFGEGNEEGETMNVCEQHCSKQEIENCWWKKGYYLRCKGRDIHPDFRESYCGQKRVSKGFPCCLCDLLEKEAKP